MNPEPKVKDGAKSKDSIAVPTIVKKGKFFITPFYQYSHFTKLKMTSEKNNYHVIDGDYSTTFSSDEVNDYNDNYGTNYTSSMVGIRVGYQVFKGLGVNGFVGVSQFNFKSWVSEENTQTASTRYPALLLGVAIDYDLPITKKLSAMALVSFNYCKSGGPETQNTSGEQVIASRLIDMYWEANLALGYRLGRFMPYLGAGVSQQFIHQVAKEQIPTTDDQGNPFYNTTEFDTHFNGLGVYGFAGVEYLITHNLSVYIRGAYPNPARATTGLRIIL